MRLEINLKKGTLIVKLKGELDLVSAHEFREKIDNMLEEIESDSLMIDISKVTFIDSSGLGVILGRLRKLKAKNGQLLLYGENRTVRKILEISGVSSLLPVCRNEEEAWKIINKKLLKEA